MLPSVFNLMSVWYSFLSHSAVVNLKWVVNNLPLISAWPSPRGVWAQMISEKYKHQICLGSLEKPFCDMVKKGGGCMDEDFIIISRNETDMCHDSRMCQCENHMIHDHNRMHHVITCLVRWLCWAGPGHRRGDTDTITQFYRGDLRSDLHKSDHQES